MNSLAYIKVDRVLLVCLFLCFKYSTSINTFLTDPFFSLVCSSMHDYLPLYHPQSLLIHAMFECYQEWKSFSSLVSTYDIRCSSFIEETMELASSEISTRSTSLFGDQSGTPVTLKDLLSTVPMFITKDQITKMNQLTTITTNCIALMKKVKL